MIGEQQAPLFVNKNLLKQIPTFQSMFAWPPSFEEALQNKVILPEDDFRSWQKAVEFLRSKDFMPYFDVNQSQKQPLIGKMAATKLKTPLFVVNCQDKVIRLDPGEIANGDASLADVTHTMLEGVLLVLRLADKYDWSDLMHVCLDKIISFPLGPRAFSAILKHCTTLCINRTEETNEDDELDEMQHKLRRKIGNVPSAMTGLGQSTPFAFTTSSPTDKLHELIDYLFETHSTGYDEAKSVIAHGNSMLSKRKSQQYEQLDQFMQENMTLEAWLIYQKMNKLRADNFGRLQGNIRLDEWICKNRRHGILESDWNRRRAEYSWTRFTRLNDHNLNTGIVPAQAGHGVELKFGGCSFAEGLTGDLITNIRMDMPAKGYVYGIIQRTQCWSFFPREEVRFLEQKETDVYYCDCCKDPTD